MDIPPMERMESDWTPFSVKLVAYWEFLKATCALLIFCGVWAVQKTSSTHTPVSQNLMNDNPAVLILPVIALYLFVVGFGIWNLMKWARWLLVPLIAYSAPWWAWAAFSLPSESDRALLAAILPQPLVWLVMTLDIAAVMMLLRPEARKAFNDIDADL
jgi:hypothetical protein